MKIPMIAVLLFPLVAAWGQHPPAPPTCEEGLLSQTINAEFWVDQLNHSARQYAGSVSDKLKKIRALTSENTALKAKLKELESKEEPQT